MREDYHLHCEFSDDSHVSMESQIEAAIDLKLDEMCFTDHVDYGIKVDWDNNEPIIQRNNDLLANVNYPLYFEKLGQMQKEYGSHITIKKGLEFGIQTHRIDQYNQLFEKYRNELDFVLLSCHQIDDKEFWTQDFQKGKTQNQYQQAYYNEILQCAKQFDHYCCLAHLDMIKRYDLNGDYPFELIKDAVTEILKVVIEKGKGIEVNTSCFRYKLKDLTPCRDILKLYKQLGGKIITIGSDAHTPEYIGNHVDEVLAILKNEFGFEEIYTFDKMKPIAHKI